MDVIVDWVYRNTEWLYTVIYRNDVFFIDYWSPVHFFSGFILYTILFAFRINYRSVVFLFLLFFYEILEILFRIFALNLFKAEIIKDQFSDIIVGIIGGLFFHVLFKRADKYLNENEVLKKITIPLSAITISFVCAATIGYDFGLESFYTPCMNLLALLIWFILLTLLILCYLTIHRYYKNIIVSLLIVLLIHILIILSIEQMTNNVYLFRKIFTPNDILLDDALKIIAIILLPFIAVLMEYGFYNIFLNAIKNFYLEKDEKTK